jgi:hypothetical protein
VPQPTAIPRAPSNYSNHYNQAKYSYCSNRRKYSNHSNQICSYFILSSTIWDNPLSTANRLRDGRPRNRNSIPGRGKRLFSSNEHPDRLRGSTEWFPRALSPKAELTIHLHLVTKLRMTGNISPLSYVFMTSCLIKNRDCSTVIKAIRKRQDHSEFQGAKNVYGNCELATPRRITPSQSRYINDRVCSEFQQQRYSLIHYSVITD